MFNVTDAGIIGATQVALTIVGIVIRDVWKDKKQAAQLVQGVETIKEHVPAAVELGETALSKIKSVFHEVVQSPEIAAKLLPLEHRVSADGAKLQETQLYDLAGVALHAYQRGLDDLSTDEKATAVQFVQTELAKIGVKVSEGEVLVGLQIADKRAKDFIGSALFQQTAQLVATKAKMAASVTNVPASTTSPAAQAAPAQ